MDMPVFPRSRDVVFDDRESFNTLFRLYPPVISEMTFTNLFAWREFYRFSVAEYSGHLLLGCGGAAPAVFLPPVGPDPVSVMMELIAASGAQFIRVPEVEAQRCATADGAVIVSDRDNADYLYDAAELASLSGAKYDGKRNLVRRFQSSFPYEYHPLTPSLIDRCRDFEHRWCSEKGCDRDAGLCAERRAFDTMLPHCGCLPLRGGAITIGGEVKAVCIGELLNPETLVIHILKAMRDYPGLYQAVFHDFLVKEARDVRYINMEQDLGVDGLRKAKLSYHPVRMVDKYAVSRKMRGSAEPQPAVLHGCSHE